jgi:putative SOS response-associated peptidase YedK
MLTATIIVSDASAWMTPYHDRMPVLLEPAQFDAWLTGAAGPEMLRPAPESALRAWVVSDRVNRSGQDDDNPALVAAVG